MGSEAPSAAGAGSVPDVPASSHGLVRMHRLRAIEFQNSVEDTLGLRTPAPVPDEPRPFETAIDDAEPWFEVAGSLARRLFQPAQLPEPLDCVGPGDAERGCALSVIDTLGLRLFRRPLLEAERPAFVGLYDTLSATEGTRAALEQVVRALLMSPAFLFHVELSDDTDGSAPERLDSYALAARLSFGLWSTTPDPALLAAASAGLTAEAALDDAFQRLATDPRVLALPDGWSDVWLGLSQLGTHRVAADVFPTFDQSLRLAMLGEQRELLRQYWLEPVPLRGLPTLDLSFVDAPLSRHYGFGPNRVGFVSAADDARSGLLGQAAILTLTSFERRVSASRRGGFVIEKLLCARLPPPAAGEVGSLGPEFPPGASERDALSRTVESPSCQGCHGLFDPVGLALAHFDAVGAYRELDSQGHAIDARVQLPESLFDGSVNIDGALELGAAIGASERFHACVAAKLASYLVHRDITDATDADLIEPLADDVAEHATLSELTRRIVMSDHFRYRRLAPVP